MMEIVLSTVFSKKIQKLWNCISVTIFTEHTYHQTPKPPKTRCLGIDVHILMSLSWSTPQHSLPCAKMLIPQLWPLLRFSSPYSASLVVRSSMTFLCELHHPSASMLHIFLSYSIALYGIPHQPCLHPLECQLMGSEILLYFTHSYILNFYLLNE